LGPENAVLSIENVFYLGLKDYQEDNVVRPDFAGDDLPDKPAAENIIHATEVSAAEHAASPRDVVIMTPLDNVVPITNRQDKIRHEVEDQFTAFS
jgi:hypothetical protein